MDFIEGLPKSFGCNVIYVVVDRFTKYAHFIPMTSHYTAKSVAEAFFDQIFRLHGLPTHIVSDRDKAFTSLFWQELFKMLGTELNLSSAYHPQSDGQTERVNRCVENYLRSIYMYQPGKWRKWLPAAEWWYNTNHHNSLQMSPFQALYGYKPIQMNLRPDSTLVAAVEDWAQERVGWNSLLKENLLKAQNRMKQMADKGRSDREFEVGEWAYLKLQPYRQTSVAVRRNIKLAAKYYGPYQVEQKLGTVAYRLKLPAGSTIHPVFHVSLLKKSPKGAPLSTALPTLNDDGEFGVAPSAVIDQRTIFRKGQVVEQVLVQWENMEPEEATWEDWTFIHAQFPTFQFNQS